MRKRICFFLPELTTFAIIELFSPSLWAILDQHGIAESISPDIVLWDGSITPLYNASGCFVFVSKHCRRDLPLLASVCCEQEHIAFYDDEVLVHGGIFTNSGGSAIQIAANRLLGSPAVV